MTSWRGTGHLDLQLMRDERPPIHVVAICVLKWQCNPMARAPVAVSRGGSGGRAAVDDVIIEVKHGVAGLRNVRVGLMQLGYDISQRPRARGYLVLPDTTITFDRLRDEWMRATSIFQPDLIARINLCVRRGDTFVGFRGEELAPAIQRVLAKYLSANSPPETSRPSRGDASFVVLKVLIQHWLTQGGPVTTRWLSDAAGYSYPTVASALAGLGSLIERQSDRRVRLRWFPRDQFSRLVAVSERARRTIRFADRSAQPRTPEAHLRRLEKVRPPNVAIGGILGSAHYFPELDLVGVPRLDLSQHSTGGAPDLTFVEKLDPALKVVDDPLEPAIVVVHQVRHANSLFTARESGLQWADPVECLLDLHEAHLDAQATQFLKALERARPKVAGPKAAA